MYDKVLDTFIIVAETGSFTKAAEKLYITHTADWWAATIESATTEEKDGAAKLLAKISIVKAYMSDTFGIDLDNLREIILRREGEVISGQVDLHSVEIK